MEIAKKSWDEYTARQELIRKRAAEAMQKWIDANGIGDRDAMIQFANILAKQGGEAAGAAACEMYDAIAAAQKANVVSSLPAEPATYKEVAMRVNGSLNSSSMGNLVAGAVETLVKQCAEDTMLQNAARDRAEFAWIPSGDTCPFCITISSRGWQTASQKLRASHAEHIHPNCNCEFAIRFDKRSNVQGYDPDALYEEYNSASDGSSKDKINAMRREHYQKNKDRINAQKREAYRKRNSKTTSNIVQEYLNRNTKGRGLIVFENGTTPNEMRDRETAQWLHDTIGGNIICLKEESAEGKNPDALWNNEYWEFKKPTSPTAIDSRLRKANKQINETLLRNNRPGDRSGVVIDISDYNGTIEEAIEIINNRANKRLTSNIDVIIRNNDEIVDIIRIKANDS